MNMLLCLLAAAPGGFECRLTGAGGAAWPAPLHGWAACASPAAAAGLSDGSYVFSVRAAGTHSTCEFSFMFRIRLRVGLALQAADRRAETISSGA